VVQAAGDSINDDRWDPASTVGGARHGLECRQLIPCNLARIAVLGAAADAGRLGFLRPRLRQPISLAGSMLRLLTPSPIGKSTPGLSNSGLRFFRAPSFMLVRYGAAGREKPG
jgi:hypothetical protein